MGVGSRVEVIADGRTQTKVVTLGNSFYSQNSQWLIFWFGEYSENVKVIVYWSSGKETLLEDIEINRDLIIIES